MCTCSPCAINVKTASGLVFSAADQHAETPDLGRDHAQAAPSPFAQMSFS